MKPIVLFASGAGSNAENIIVHFKNSSKVIVAAILCNNPNAGVIEKALLHNIPLVLFTKDGFLDGSVLQQIKEFKPSLIVLAGFLLKFPASIIDEFPRKIINIHPALLPKYGGKGMYGHHVHRAIIENHEAETGISIHYVDENYDNGAMIFQQTVNIQECTTAEEVAKKVQAMEQRYFPEVIQQLLAD